MTHPHLMSLAAAIEGVLGTAAAFRLRTETSRIQRAISIATIVVALIGASAGVAGAQAIRWHNDTPNCHIFAPHIDNPVDYTHYYTQPAIAWDAEYAALSLAAGYGLHKVTPLPAWADAAIPTIGFGLVPHLLGYRHQGYDVSLHWVFVLWDRATPAFWVVAHRDDTAGVKWKNHLKATSLFLAGYAATMCFDR